MAANTPDPNVPLTTRRFLCSACLEDKDGEIPALLPDDTFLCNECFDQGYRPKFIEALATESSYPVECAGQEMAFRNYAHFFDAAFAQDFRTKEVEYNVPSKNRLYCPNSWQGGRCENYLGTTAAHVHDQACATCSGYACARCKGAWGGPGRENYQDHRESCKEWVQEENTVEGLERGVDYQLCPECKARYSLLEGCNHMRCTVGRCHTHFCYICGEKAGPLGHHWGGPDYPEYKGCPGWGQPGENNDHYIPVEAMEENDTFRNIMETRHEFVYWALYAHIEDIDIRRLLLGEKVQGWDDEVVQQGVQSLRLILEVLYEGIAEDDEDEYQRRLQQLRGDIGRWRAREHDTSMHLEVSDDLQDITPHHDTAEARLRRMHRRELEIIEERAHRSGHEDVIDAAKWTSNLLTLYTLHQEGLGQNMAFWRKSMFDRTFDAGPAQTNHRDLASQYSRRYPKLFEIITGVEALRGASWEEYEQGIPQAAILERFGVHNGDDASLNPTS